MALAAALLAVPSIAGAKTFTSTMQLNAKVVQSCDVFALPLMFGTLPNGSFVVDKTSTITITCSPNTSFTVGIDNGLHFNNSRRMQRQSGGGARFLGYELYSNAARTARWGTSAAQIISRTTPANGVAIPLAVYGRTSGNVGAGPYLDTVTISVTF